MRKGEGSRVGLAREVATQYLCDGTRRAASAGCE
jgi:hypothetical protein